MPFIHPLLFGLSSTMVKQFEFEKYKLPVTIAFLIYEAAGTHRTWLWVWTFNISKQWFTNTLVCHICIKKIVGKLILRREGYFLEGGVWRRLGTLGGEGIIVRAGDACDRGWRTVNYGAAVKRLLVPLLSTPHKNILGLNKDLSRTLRFRALQNNYILAIIVSVAKAT